MLTPAQVARIIELYPDHTQSEIAQIINCLPRQVNGKISSLLSRRKLEPKTRRYGALRIREVRRAVQVYFQISKADLVGPRRPAKIAVPRLIGYALAREFTPASYPQIAIAFGRGDHTTILSGIKSVARRRCDNADFAEIYEHLRIALTAHAAQKMQGGHL